MIKLSAYFLPFNIPPLFCATIACIVGICLAAYYPFYALPISITFGIITLIAKAFNTHAQNNKTLILISSLFFVCAASATMYKWQQYNHKQFYLLIGEKPLDIRGIVMSMDILKHARLKNRITLKIKTFKHKEDLYWQQQQKTIHIYVRTTNNIQVGDTIELQQVIFKKPKNSSFNNYLIKENIAATIFTYKIIPRLIFRPAYSYKRCLFQLREKTLERCRKKLSPMSFALVSSLFLGNRGLVKKRMDHTKEQFKTWGISHFLARSGLHLVIFIMIWQSFLSFFPLHFTLKQIILLFLGIVYYALSWSSTSFLRAFFTFILYKICILASVPIHFIHLLTLVCFFMLMHNPMQLFFLDFQLSFGLTCALGWFNYLQNQKCA